jgi:hypothetical protein
MHRLPEGPLSRIDDAALATAAKIQGIYTWPTVSILVSFWTYLVALIVAAVFSRFYAAGGTRTLVVMSLPLLTLLLHFFISYMVYRASDEYLRLRILKCAALAGVLLAFGTTAYFGLEQLGYPRLSIIVVNLIGWTLFTIMLIWVRHRAR